MTSPALKTCSKCDTPKSRGEFADRPDLTDKKFPWCDTCRAAYDRSSRDLKKRQRAEKMRLW
jgi:CRISPR/Cas system-associated protein Cas10 (large subunit of type III CRISPR-Cas system)